jgi:hypothetical protein
MEIKELVFLFYGESGRDNIEQSSRVCSKQKAAIAAGASLGLRRERDYSAPCPMDSLGFP